MPPPRRISDRPRKVEPSWIWHIYLGGNRRHKMGIAASAIIATERGYEVERMDSYRPGQEGQVPDLMLRKEVRVKREGRPFDAVKFFRVEVVDSNDPVPDWHPGFDGFDECYKVFLSKWDKWCAGGHGGELMAQSGGTDLVLAHPPHPPCLDGLFHIVEEAIP